MSIVVDAVSKSYQDNTVLTNFSYTFEEGQRYCLVAPSGFGKTTLLRLLLGLEQANSGTIRGMAGLATSTVFQEDRLCQYLSVGSNLRLVLAREQSASDMLEEGLIALGLKPHLKQPIYELSGGMKRRVAILRALLYQGDIFVLDEPFRGLDTGTKNQVIDYTKKQTEGKTTIWVTHDSSELSLFPSIVVPMNELQG